jgi:MurNAc alpha-1-phosphate uridylyltransferase
MSPSPRFPEKAGLPDVVLLAAGLGQRMRPLTDKMPKPLLEVGGVTLLDRVIAEATAEGFSHFVVNTHHHAAQVRAHVAALAQREPTLRFRLSDEPELLETGGAVKQALALLETDPLLVMNTDAFWPPGNDAPLKRLLTRIAEDGADIVLLCAQPSRALGFRRGHDFCLDPRGRLTRDAGQPVIYAGVALIRRSIVETATGRRFSLYPLFIAALERQRLAGVALDAPWLHVGDPEALAAAENFLSAPVS